jgi:hypothetical protein
VDGGPNGHSLFVDRLLEAIRDGLADTNPVDNYVTFDELSAYLISRASTQYQTPASGELPGHGAGEFVFKVGKPKANVARAAPTTAPAGSLRGEQQPESSPVGQRKDIGQIPEMTPRALAPATAASDTDEKWQQAQQAFKEKKWDTALSLSRELADAGDVRGMFYLGRLYTLGRGVPQSWDQEKYWYEKSAAGGYCYAMYMLGLSYSVNGDTEHAKEWWRKGVNAQPAGCASMCAKRVASP